jgi:hypothetical protein
LLRTAQYAPALIASPDRQDRAHRSAVLPVTLTLIAVTLFTPVELSFYIFGLRLSPTRFIFIAIAPYLMVKLFQKIGQDRYRFVRSDLFFGLTAIWMIYAPANIDGLLPAITHAGPEVLEIFIAYLAARTLLSEPGQAQRFIERLCQVIAAAAIIALLDPLTGQYVSKELSAQLTGYPRYFTRWDDAYRLGLLRAAGPVEHPILLGFVCAVGVLLSATGTMRARHVILIASLAGAFFSFSSAPVQSLILGFGLIYYAKFSAGIPYRWTILFVLGSLAVAATFVISNNPLGFLISNLIFDPASGYYRVWTWYAVLDHLSLSPWFGLGYGVLPEEINHTIDAMWLVVAIHSGYPGAVLTFLSLIGASSIATTKRVFLTKQDQTLSLTLGIVCFLTIFLTITVHFWGSLWVLTGLLAGIRAHLGELGRLSYHRRTAAPARAPSAEASVF